MQVSEKTLHIPPEWRTAADEILAGGGPVMVIGVPGAGKTTFCQYLAGHFYSRGKRVAWIDADPGQPFIGPPAVYSLGIYTDAAELLRRKPPLVMAFIGNTSPVGHLLDAVAALKKLYDRAQTLAPDVVIINTSGLVNGGAARELRFHEIDMLAPRYVVALESKNEVDHLVSPHAHRAGLLILRLPQSLDAKVLTSEARKAAREQRFKEYFRGAEFADIALADVGIHGHGLGTGERLGFRDINILSNALHGIVIHAELAADRLFVVTDGEFAEEELYAAKERYGAREITIVKRAELDYLLVGLNDDRNLCLGMGIIRDIDLKELVLRVVTPLHDVGPIRHVAMGTLRVNPAGNELGQW